MYYITLISTAHTEYGKCNSDELYKIIDAINPQIIFEEVPSHLFDMLYGEIPFPDEPLEVKCVRRYSKDHNIKHIPVDDDKISELPSASIDFMFNTFKKYDVYRKIEEEQYLLADKDGFAYLNSQECFDLFATKRATEQYLLNFGIQNICKLFYEEQDNRERIMLNNIYSYSRENQYQQAIFLLGAGHRASIIQKIKKYNTERDLILNWSFYGDLYY